MELKTSNNPWISLSCAKFHPCHFFVYFFCHYNKFISSAFELRIITRGYRRGFTEQETDKQITIRDSDRPRANSSEIQECWSYMIYVTDQGNGGELLINIDIEYLPAERVRPSSSFTTVADMDTHGQIWYLRLIHRTSLGTKRRPVTWLAFKDFTWHEIDLKLSQNTRKQPWLQPAWNQYHI